MEMLRCLTTFGVTSNDDLHCLDGDPAVSLARRLVDDGTTDGVENSNGVFPDSWSQFY
jgi:hypothetical protein